MNAHPFHLTAPKMAVLSDDRAHRYWLVRQWEKAKPLLVVCMYNPSTADAKKDDPTILRLCKWAKLWGYGGILVINLYSLRSSDPADVRLSGKLAWGDAQHQAIGHALAIAADQETPVLAAWGNLTSAADVIPFRKAAAGIDLICLGLTNGGAPKHPMARGRSRIPDNQQPLLFELAIS